MGNRRQGAGRPAAKDRPRRRGGSPTGVERGSRLAQVAAITGASSGIGRAVARHFLRAGGPVALLARRGGLLDELLGQERPGGGDAWACPGDATDPAAVQAFVDGTVARFKRLDVLVLAVGWNVPDRALTSITPERFRSLIDANLHSAFLATHAALPHLRRQEGGLIIYISSVSAIAPDASGAAYQAAKHGLTGLANAVRFEEQRHGIRASLICPGVVDTPLLRQRPQPPAPQDLARALQPEDVAAACAFLAELPPRAVVPELVIRPTLLT